MKICGTGGAVLALIVMQMRHHGALERFSLFDLIGADRIFQSRSTCLEAYRFVQGNGECVPEGGLAPTVKGRLSSLGSGCDHVYFSVGRLPDFIPDAVRQIVGVDRQLLPHALHLLCRAVAGRETMPLASVAL